MALVSGIGHLMVSNIRHPQLYNPVLETKRHCPVMVNFPDSLRGIPFTSRLFDAALQISFMEFNAQADDGQLFRRRPVGFFDNDFDSGEAKAMNHLSLSHL
jgi:hypothetical protein